MRAEKNLPKCMFISWDYGVLPVLIANPWICHSQFYILCWHSSSLLYRFVVCFLVCHVYLRVTMTSSIAQCTDMDWALLCVSHIQRGMFYVQIFVYHTYKEVRFMYRYLCITHTKRYVLCTDICVSHIQRGTFYVQICEDKWLTMFFKTRWRFSVISHRRTKPLGWEMTEKRPRVLKNILNYFIAMIVCLSRIW
jgi:hypothetical protein